MLDRHDVRQTPVSIWMLIPIAALAIVLGHSLWILVGPADRLTTFLPDDAFYYVAIARSFADTGVASADGGITITSGYHVLWMHFLAAAYRIYDGGVLSDVRIAAGLSLAAVAAVAVGVLARLGRNRDTAGLLAIALILTSYSVIFGAPSAMEWAVTVAVSVLYWWCFAARAGERGTLAALFALGVVGSLCRSDFGGQAASLLAAAIVMRIWRRSPAFLKPAIAGLVGAGVGVVLVGLNHYLLTGAAAQNSAMIKAAWGQVSSHNPAFAIHQFLRALLYIPNVDVSDKIGLKLAVAKYVLIGVLALGLAFFVARRRILAYIRLSASRIQFTDNDLFLGLAAGIAILFYLALYSLSPLALQFWYTANVLVPIFVLVRMALRIAPVGVYAVVVLSAVNLVVFSLAGAPYQNGLQSAAVLSQYLSGQVVGISDSGVIRLFSSARVVNTDGLVNDDISGYLPRRLHCYLADKGIDYVSGFGTTELVFSPPWKEFAQPVEFHSDRATVSLWKVDRAALARRPECAKQAVTTANR